MSDFTLALVGAWLVLTENPPNLWHTKVVADSGLELSCFGLR